MNDLRVVERLRLLGCMGLVLLLLACSSLGSGPPPSDQVDTPCPSQIQDEIKVLASASATRDPASPGNFTHMLVGRQVLIAVSPGTAATGLHLLSSVLTVTSIGGTFERVLSPRDSDVRAIDVIPGRLRIAPFVTGGTLRPQSVSLDLLVAPGGAATDEMIVTQDALWDAQRRPLPPEQVTISLTPVQHFTMYDEVRATLSLTLVLAPSRSARQRWSCSAESQFTLVDRAAATPQLWDLRKSVPAGRSQLWLALFNDRWGAFRAVFASPGDAAGFADWLRQTHEHRAGVYRFGMFRPEYSRERLRTVPTSHSITDTFQEVSPDDLDSLVVGRLGEP